MISLIKKLSAAIRATPTQHQKVIIDNTAIELFEKEIAACELSLQLSKKHLSTVVSGKIAAKRKLSNQLENTLNKKEAILIKQSQGDRTTANQLSDELFTLEEWAKSNEQTLKQLECHEQATLKVLKNTAQTLGHYRHEMKVAKAASQRNSATLDSPTISASNIANMQLSLHRLKQRC